jgi:hypothetical protein
LVTASILTRKEGKVCCKGKSGILSKRTEVEARTQDNIGKGDRTHQTMRIEQVRDAVFREH